MTPCEQCRRRPATHRVTIEEPSYRAASGRAAPSHRRYATRALCAACVAAARRTRWPGPHLVDVSPAR